MLLIAESMPATSEMVPLIEIYLTIVMALTSLSIVLTVYVLQLHHSGPVVIPIPHAFKYSVVHYIAPLIGMKQIVKIYAQEHNLIETDDVYRSFAEPKSKPMDSPLIQRKSPMHYRVDLHQQQGESLSEDESMKQCLPSTNNNYVANGNLRSGGRSTMTAAVKKRSRSRPPQIVLIPQHHPLPSSSTSSLIKSTRTHYDLFNSNLFLLEKHLKHLIDKQKHDEGRNEMINEWKLMALIMDRLLFWLFASLTTIGTLFCLILIPYLKNAGYISALAKDSVYEFQANETLSSILNLTQASPVVEK